jgi:hypothetical protein
MRRSIYDKCPQVRQTNPVESYEPVWGECFQYALKDINVKEVLGLRVDIVQVGVIEKEKIIGSVILDWSHIRNCFGGNEMGYPVLASKKGRSNSRKVTLIIQLSPNELPSTAIESPNPLPPASSFSSFGSFALDSSFEEKDKSQSESSGLLESDLLDLSFESESSSSFSHSPSSSFEFPAPPALTSVELFSNDSLCFTTDMSLAPFDFLLPALTCIPEDFLFFNSLQSLEPLLSLIPKFTLHAFLHENHEMKGIMEYAFQSFNLEEGSEVHRSICVGLVVFC